jgi:DnaK suppressor protein
LLLRRRGDQMARLAELTTGEAPSAIDEHAEIAQRLVREELSEIESALARLKTGTYGSCERCGDHIPRDRLDAIPHVHTCLACAA